MKDFHSSLESAQRKSSKVILAAPLNEQEKAEIKRLEEQERAEQEQLLRESEQELLDEEQEKKIQDNHQKMRDWDRKKWLFLSLCYIGHSPKAPGTFASLVAVLLGLPILYYLHASNLLMLAILLGLFAIKWVNEYEAAGGVHDDKRIVIDELVGTWIALGMIGFGVVEALLAFVLFRFFDISKPSVIGRVDRNVRGGLGVVGDDVLAGFFAGLLGLIVLGVLNSLGLWDLQQLPTLNESSIIPE